MKIEYIGHTKLASNTITIKKENNILDCHMFEYNDKLKIGKLVIVDNCKQSYDDLTGWLLIAQGSHTFKINNITFLDSLVVERQIHFRFDSISPWK